MIIFGHIPVLVEVFWATYDPAKLQICPRLLVYQQYFSSAIQIFVGASLIMRVYALYNCNIRVLVCLVILPVILIVVDAWLFLGGKNTEVMPDVLVYTGCAVPLSHYQAIRYAISWSTMLVFDLVILCMTLYKTLTLPRPTNAGVLTLLRRDGVMYFGVVTASNLFNILCFLLADPLSKFAGTTLTNVISSMMITRMMLNLRDPSLVRSGTASEDQTGPDLTFVLYHCSTELSNQGRLSDYEASREGLEEDLDHAGSSSSSHHDIELDRMDV